MVSARLILSDVGLCACCADSLYVRWCKCSVLDISSRGLGNRGVMYVESTLRLCSGCLSALLPNLPLFTGLVASLHDLLLAWFELYLDPIPYRRFM